MCLYQVSIIYVSGQMLFLLSASPAFTYLVLNRNLRRAALRILGSRFVSKFSSSAEVSEVFLLLLLLVWMMNIYIYIIFISNKNLFRGICQAVGAGRLMQRHVRPHVPLPACSSAPHRRAVSGVECRRKSVHSKCARIVPDPGPLNTSRGKELHDQKTPNNKNLSAWPEKLRSRNSAHNQFRHDLLYIYCIYPKQNIWLFKGKHYLLQVTLSKNMLVHFLIQTLIY